MEEETMWLVDGDAYDLFKLDLGSSASSHRRCLPYRQEQLLLSLARLPLAI